MEKCTGCKSERIIQICGKTSDCFNAYFKNKEYSDYIPDELKIGGGDYIEFSYCADCGKIQGDFPIRDKDLDEVFNEDNN